MREELAGRPWFVSNAVSTEDPGFEARDKPFDHSCNENISGETIAPGHNQDLARFQPGNGGQESGPLIDGAAAADAEVLVNAEQLVIVAIAPGGDRRALRLGSEMLIIGGNPDVTDGRLQGVMASWKICS